MNEPEQLSPKWIPVEERLPEYMRSALVWCPENQNVFCAYYHFYAGSEDADKVPIWCFFDNLGIVTEVGEPVTHWTPVPLNPLGSNPTQ